MMAPTESKLVCRDEKEGNLISIARKAYVRWDAMITGAAEFGKHETLVLAPLRLVQAFRNGEFLHQLDSEVQRLIDKGKIKPDYLNSEQGKACFQELLAALENPPVDERRFQAVRAVFLAAASEDKSNRSELLPQLLLGIAASLDPGELDLLATEYRILRNRDPYQISDVTGWQRFIAHQSSLGVSSLVARYEESLTKKRLLLGRTFSDSSGVETRVIDGGSLRTRLSDLGEQLCDFISHGQNLESETSDG